MTDIEKLAVAHEASKGSTELSEMVLELVRRGWDYGPALDQCVLWGRGVRDIRIADDTFGAYETVRYGR